MSGEQMFIIDHNNYRLDFMDIVMGMTSKMDDSVWTEIITDWLLAHSVAPGHRHMPPVVKY